MGKDLKEVRVQATWIPGAEHYRQGKHAWCLGGLKPVQRPGAEKGDEVGEGLRGTSHRALKIIVGTLCFAQIRAE